MIGCSGQIEGGDLVAKGGQDAVDRETPNAEREHRV